jgi:hypothetical protein
MFSLFTRSVKSYLYHSSTTLLLFLTALGGLLVASFYIQPSHDSAWILHDAQLLIHSANPVHALSDPLVVNLLMHLIPAWLSELFGWQLLFAFKLYCVVLMLTLLVIYYFQIRSISGNTRTTLLFLLFILPLLFPPLIDFGQRDHWILCFILAYIFTAAGRQLQRNINPFIAGISGFLAAIAVLLKPHYVLVLIAIELYMLLSQRSFSRHSIRHLFRIENSVIALVGIIYTLAILILVPDAIKVTLPTLFNFYWTYSRPFAERLFIEHFIILFLLCLSLWLTLPAKVKKVQNLAFVCIFSTYGVFLLLGNTWQYRQFPFLGLAWTCLIAGIFYRISARSNPAINRSIPSGKVPAIINVLMLLFIGHWLLIDKGFASDFAADLKGNNPAWTIRTNGIAEEEQAFADIPQVKSIYVMDTNLHPHTVFMVEHHLLWVSRYHSLWLLPGWAKIHSGEKQLDANQMAAMESTIADFHKNLDADLQANPPDAFIIDVSPKKDIFGDTPFDYIAHFQQYVPFFNTIWPEYTHYKKFYIGRHKEREIAIYVKTVLLKKQ